MKYKLLLTMAICISLLSLSCAYATDSNDTDVELGLNDEEPLNLELNDNGIKSANEDMPKITADASIGETSDNSSAYLILDNDADKENVYINDYVTWFVSVINKGPDTAKNVKVFDQLPDGLRYVKHQTTKGTFDYETGVWDIGDLSVDDDEVFLYITTLAMTAGEKINKATLTTDSTNLNNECYEEEEIYVFEHAKNRYEGKSQTKAHAFKAMYPTGNPLYLVFVSLISIFMILSKSRE